MDRASVRKLDCTYLRLVPACVQLSVTPVCIHSPVSLPLTVSCSSRQFFLLLCFVLTFTLCISQNKSPVFVLLSASLSSIWILSSFLTMHTEMLICLQPCGLSGSTSLSSYKLYKCNAQARIRNSHSVPTI